MNRPNRIGILAHPKRPQTTPVAHRIMHTLQTHGIETWCHIAWQAEDVVDDVKTADVVVAIGGDGAMLAAARVCAPFNVPVLGVNMGRLGFLTEIAQHDDWDLYLERLLSGDYWIENRMMITATLYQDGAAVMSGDALNDVVISGDRIGHMVQLDMFIDGHWATSYNADALIVATPTGSTAYALASGGPILPPDLSNILIVPTAPHLSMDRPIVVSEGVRVVVQPADANRYPIIISADGTQLGELEQGDALHIRACDYSAKFARMRGRNYFYRSLLDRLEPRITRPTNARPKFLNLNDAQVAPDTPEQPATQLNQDANGNLDFKPDFPDFKPDFNED